MSKITLTQTTPASIATPPSGKRTMFVDSGDGRFKSKDSTGAVSNFEQSLSNSTPAAIGAAAAGTGTSASRDDHVHALAASGVQTTHIANAAVTSAKIANDAVGNAQLANMAANTIKANATASVGDPSDFAVTAQGLLGRGAADLTNFAVAANQFLARASAGNLEAKAITDFGLSLVDDANAAAARTTLGLVIGTDVQAFDATLNAFAALTISANSLTIGTGADAFSQTTFAANTFPARASTGDLVAKPITDFGLSLVDDADAATARTTLGLASGTYTPTLTNVANLDASTAFQCQYLRVGNVVTVSGRVDADPTAAGLVQLGISLPIASNFSTANQAAGTAAAAAVAGQSAAIVADATNDRAEMQWTAVDTANRSMYFSFTYEVI